MSRAKLKNAVARIMREGNIDFEKIDYETIRERHRARLMLVQEWFYSEHAKKKSNAPEIRSALRAMLKHGELAEEIQKAKSLLKDDTSERWAADQAAIEAYALRKHGHLKYVKRSWAYGANADEMYEHWRELINEPERLRRERDQRRLEERARVEKARGKPVRLTVDHPDNTVKHYTPTFADGSTGWGLSYLYPFSDFPEYGGAHYVKLDDDDDGA